MTCLRRISNSPPVMLLLFTGKSFSKSHNVFKICTSSYIYILICIAKPHTYIISVGLTPRFLENLYWAFIGILILIRYEYVKVLIIFSVYISYIALTSPHTPPSRSRSTALPVAILQYLLHTVATIVHGTADTLD